MTAFISTADLAMPAKPKGTRNGSTPRYPFADLPVGKSIAVTDKTKKQLTTTLSTANRKEWPAIDSKGKALMMPKLKEDKTPELGTDGKPVMVQKTEKRSFFAVECDPATDPDKATVRIWREA